MEAQKSFSGVRVSVVSSSSQKREGATTDNVPAILCADVYTQSTSQTLGWLKRG